MLGRVAYICSDQLRASHKRMALNLLVPESLVVSVEMLTSAPPILQGVAHCLLSEVELQPRGSSLTAPVFTQVSHVVDRSSWWAIVKQLTKP